MEKRNVYMDHAATTYVKQEVVEAMIPYFTEKFGNPSSIYSHARVTNMAIDESRESIAKAINGDRREIFFTGGGSEADNWAIKGIAYAYKNKGNHIITTTIEHHAVLHACEYLEKHGFEVTYLPVDEKGLVNVEDFRNAIKESTILATIMFANNEIGSIQPIKEIGEICKDKGVIFHTDAVQAVGHIPVDVKELNVDLLSMAAHKFYGPKGVGALYVRKGIRIHNLIHGGGQERNRRAGTENIPAIIGMAKALELAIEGMDEENKKLCAQRDKMIEEILAKVPYSRLNGPTGEKRLPGNVNITFEFIEGESILLMLDAKGIAASSGSACTSGSLDPSHVLLAIGLPHEIAHGSLRLSLGEKTTNEDVEYVIDVVPEIIERLRMMSPLWDNVVKGEK